MFSRLGVRLGTLTLLLALSVQAPSAQTLFEKLVMPGDLVDAHADLETDCANCHEPFSKKSQRMLCLDCHKDIDADIANGVGFHGRNGDVGETECKHCHTDHLGREADIVKLDPDTFDHALTDFQLAGKHQTVSCTGCHQDGTRYRDTPDRCIACHRDDDPHQSRLGEFCESCHTETGWQATAPFDHTLTAFPLEGAHDEVACKACHVAEQYAGLPSACADCHRINDVHKGRFGAKCDTCHGPLDWTRANFDHDQQTDFPLTGKHAAAKCEACHTGVLDEQELSTGCVTCHREQDAHDGQLGEDCSTCHRPTGWAEAVAFDHDITGFPLVGLHAVVPCEECHVTSAFKDASPRCVDCHKEASYHSGRLGQDCAACHSPVGWARWDFDHDTQTRYPLTGRHRYAHCHSCHAKKDVSQITLSTECYDCHKSDDVHLGSFGPDCARCHSTQSFTDISLKKR